MRGIAPIQAYWPIALLVLFIGTVFSQTLDFAPSFDDRALIGDGAASGATPDEQKIENGAALFLKPFQTDFWGIAMRADAPANSPYYRPIPALFITLERLLFKNIAMIRIAHTTLFIIALLLLFLLVRRLYPFLSPSHAAIGCAFFSLFPWVPDVVLFLSSICDLLVINFILLALLSFLQFFNHGKRQWLILYGIATLLAVLSKETAYVLPLVCLILFFVSRHRPSNVRIWMPLVISSAILVGALILRAVVIKSNTTATLLDAIVSLPWALGMSLRYSLFSYPPVMEISCNGDVLWAGLGALAAIIALFFFLARRKKQSDAKIPVLVWFLLLTPSLFAIATSRLFAPRYLFVPSVGLAVGIARLSEWSSKKKIGAHNLWSPKYFGQVAVRLGLLIIIGINSWLMIDRTVTWKDGITLWSVEIGRNPESLTAHINLGNLLAEQGRGAEALAIMMRTIDLAVTKHQPCEAAAASLNASNLLISSNPERVQPLLEKQLGRCPRLDAVIKKRLAILSRMDRPR